MRPLNNAARDGGGGGVGGSRYQRQMGGGSTRRSGWTNQSLADRNNSNTYSRDSNLDVAGTSASDIAQERAAFIAEQRRWRQVAGQAVEQRMGFRSWNRETALARSTSVPQQRRGWLFHMLPATVTVANQDSSSMTASSGAERSGLDLYFVAADSDDNADLHASGSCKFKATLLYRPYFYVVPDLTPLLASGAAGQLDVESADLQGQVALALLTRALYRLLEDAECSVYHIAVTYKLDLDQPNHLKPTRGGVAGRPVLKLLFDNVAQLMLARDQVRRALERQHHQRDTMAGGDNHNHTFWNDASSATTTTTEPAWKQDPLQLMTDMREYDVPYVVRVCTDLEIRAGTWYTVQVRPEHYIDIAAESVETLSSNAITSNNMEQETRVSSFAASNKDNEDHVDDENNRDSTSSNVLPMDDHGGIRLLDPDRESKANPTFLAFDIECTKAPLKFPSAEVDEIFMISYMVSAGSTSGGAAAASTTPHGYLIVSRSVVSQDVHDFEYTPTPNYPGPFTIFNEVNEKALLQRFFAEYQKHAPQIVVTYNGDFFDLPFVETRAKFHGLDMFSETGLEKTSGSGSGGDDGYCGRCCVHLDAFHWVQRDSYLPQGAQGLKAVTKYKLGYDPVEVDPEDMMSLAHERPVHMATYSVSDAVATFYLYEKYVHLFIFSLATIIPMGPEDVLRKGSGTLCEALLMVQACTKGILCPNKHVEPIAQFHHGQHLLESETYIGGKVECLETGVYRSDLPYEFDLNPAAFDKLIANIDRDLTFAIEVEGGKQRNDIVNYDEIRNEIVEKLEKLRDRPKRVERPYVYHLDISAMYPNIILTNRLQPSAIVDDATCAACHFNLTKNQCKRRMKWIWRGDFNPARRSEYDRTRDQLLRESFPDGRTFAEMAEKEQASLVAKRLKMYADKAYKRTKITQEEEREDIVCMRENDFYVNTVRQFRDRRYEFKKLNSTWKKKAAAAEDPASKKQCADRVLVYDSLQVAHKCILNSFYGYVMRKGARWRSMPMAGIVTKTGSDMITQARVLVEQIGRPLELDTDGIWCILPNSFPDVYNFRSPDGSMLKLEYPCVMLNADVHNTFTNHQYQTLVDAERGIYETHSECSMFFEVDGPYRCMVIPASTEEGKLLKKRYAVFNFDGSLAELKGFELKRRGELELIKTFQSQVFERFLDGSTLDECYSSVAEIANHWIDVIDTRGESLDDDELFDLISENRNMSRQLDDYGDQKGTSQTTARRLGEFLGAEIIKDKGLSCKFIIAEQPYGAPVTERAIPTAIWKAELAVRRHYLRKWLKAPGLDGEGLDIRNVLDWEYYLDRLGKTIQKIVTIPAALQKVSNPVPRVEHPAWLNSKVNQLNDRFQQKSIRDMFGPANSSIGQTRMQFDNDIEDIATPAVAPKRPLVRSIKRGQLRSEEVNDTAELVPSARVSLSKETFGDWLSQKKAGWRKSRRERRTVSLSGHSHGTGIEKRQKKVVSIEGFVREAALSVSQNEWHIVEVREMSSFDSLTPGDAHGSGEFIVWAMVGTDSLQKIVVRVPRVFHIATCVEAQNISDDIIGFRRVDKHLPHNKNCSFLYEVTMLEHIFQSNTWTESIQPVNPAFRRDHFLEVIYESATPLALRVLSDLGNAARVKSSRTQNSTKEFMLSDLARVDKPVGGEYLHKAMVFRRLFLYVRINHKTKTGIVSVFSPQCKSGLHTHEASQDLFSDAAHPSQSPVGSFDVGASCSLWIVTPGARARQKNVSSKQCEIMIRQLLQSLQEAVGLDSEYSCISPHSEVSVSSLQFVESEELAYAGANEIINSHAATGGHPTMILLNSSRPTPRVRRYMSVFGSYPVISMPFPPGPAHNPHQSTLPSLNWEQPVVQLSLEAYIFVMVIAFPKRVAFARYGHLPLGNLNDDEIRTIFDVSLSRLIQKNRALLWASAIPGRPDLGSNFLPGSEGITFLRLNSGFSQSNHDDIWEDDDGLVSPVVRHPGCYRSICVDVDLQDLTVAALAESFGASACSLDAGPLHDVPINLNSPNSVTFNGNFNPPKVSSPLGDEMSTSISLPIVRTLVGGWLRDAMATGSHAADELLHHIYRLVSDPNSLLHDPALNRVVHSLMKTTFSSLLGELKRLGCSIVFASFNRITIATNKLELADAEEYINFIISTARRNHCGKDDGVGLSRISLRPRQFHSHLIFMDEYNFGTMQLERVSRHHLDDSQHSDLVVPDGADSNSMVICSVVTAWSIMNYLGSEIGQEYFRAIMARFSKDVMREQLDLIKKDGDLSVAPMAGYGQELLNFKRKMISKHFASYLTRALGEITKEGQDKDYSQPPLASKSTNPALEFIKNVIVVLELDSDVQKEVYALKRSLLAQVGVAEYAQVASWENPCPRFILPDLFCMECHESKDVNLCYIPPRALNDEEYEKDWICDDCGNPYDISIIENRLLSILHKKIARYQLQDLRCIKTNRVARRALAPLSECSAGVKLDTSQHDTIEEIRLLHRLAQFHELEMLEQVADGMLRGF